MSTIRSKATTRERNTSMAGGWIFQVVDLASSRFRSGDGDHAALAEGEPMSTVSMTSARASHLKRRVMASVMLVPVLTALSVLVPALAAPAAAASVCTPRSTAVRSWGTTGTSVYLVPGASLQTTASGTVYQGKGAYDPEGIALPGDLRIVNLQGQVEYGPWVHIGKSGVIRNDGSTTQRIRFRVYGTTEDSSGSFTAKYETCDEPGMPASQHDITAVKPRHISDGRMCLGVRGTAHAAGASQYWCYEELIGANRWTVRPLGNGYAEIIAQHSGKCLDVAHMSKDHAAPVVQGTCWRGDNQQWLFQPVGDGYYQVVNRHSTMCLDVAHAATTAYAPVVQATCWGGPNQQWRFER